MNSEKDNKNSIKPKTGSFRELADLLGVGRSTVSKAVSSGRLKNSIIRDTEPPTILLAEAVIEWFSNTDRRKSRSDLFFSGKSLSEIPSRQESEQVKAYFEAKEANRLDDLKEGKAVPLDVAAKKMQKIGKTLRDRLLNVGNAVADEISPEDPCKARNIINREIENALREFCLNRMGLKQ